MINFNSNKKQRKQNSEYIENALGLHENQNSPISSIQNSGVRGLLIDTDFEKLDSLEYKIPKQASNNEEAEVLIHQRDVSMKSKSSVGDKTAQLKNQMTTLSEEFDRSMNFNCKDESGSNKPQQEGIIYKSSSIPTEFENEIMEY